MEKKYSSWLGEQNWKFCPLCGAPRPEKEKGLAEKLKENNIWVYQGVCSYPKPNWEVVAQTAIDHAIEIVESVNPTNCKTYLAAEAYKVEVIKRLRESL